MKLAIRSIYLILCTNIMAVLYKHRDIVALYEKVAKSDRFQRGYRTTPFIITFCETVVTEFDIHSFIELGLRVVRFKMSNLTKSDKVSLMALLNKALKWCCEKYDVSAWPVALSIDVPNACIKTGFISDKIPNALVFLKENSIVEISSDTMYWTKCDEGRIFIDDPYALAIMGPGTEIAINFGEIIMFCIEKIDDMNIKCKVSVEGTMTDLEFVCVRNITHTKPPLAKKDLEIIEFAKIFKFDIITINSVRTAETLKRIKKLFVENKPLLISTICEQQGLDNLEAIVEESDGIILAREFLAHEILDQYKMISIQLYANGVCKKRGKPFYLSGNVLDATLLKGKLTGNDLSDITNAVLQGCGFVLRKFKDPPNLIKAMRILNEVCQAVEPLTFDHQFWRLAMEYKLPVNAAEAAVLSTVFLAKITQSLIIIVPTVTGRTIKQVVHMSTDSIVVAITSSPLVAKQLQLFRGVIAIIYDKKSSKNWQFEMETRIKFAVAYGIKFEVLRYGSSYVVLRKALPTSSYCDHVSSWKVQTDEEVMRMG